ncbi:hypothetical protein B0H11DRAFT_1714586 [Mycena galericulata]|nr:hypothetical protein B0H11DRAFT_1714586 [Mycena galericulata]
MSDPGELFTCSNCRKGKSATEFSTKSNGARAKTCMACQRRTRESAQRKKAEKENLTHNGNPEEEADGAGLAVLPLDDFLNALTQQDDNLELEARVDISSISGTRREKSDQLAKCVWNRMKYRFVYHSKYDHKRAPSTRFMYHCAQSEARQNAPRKSEGEGVKHRDKISMDAFECHGWLHVTVNDWDDIAFVKLLHQDDHVPYWSIDVPPDVVEFVRQNPKLTPTQLWDEILKAHPKPSFTRRAIYAMWAETNAAEWKRDPDEIKSANILLEEFTAPKPGSGGKEPLYSVEPIPLTPQPGFTAIAFALPKLLREVGGRVRELSLDSAWNTNGSRYEVYALLGEVYGSGMPLGYLLVQSTPDSESGGKEKFLRQLLSHFREVWKIRALATLTDKDWSEIKAFMAEAVKTRLAILRRRPAHYAVEAAHAEFDWIDLKFVPISQSQEIDPVSVILSKC